MGRACPVTARQAVPGESHAPSTEAGFGGELSAFSLTASLPTTGQGYQDIL